MPLETELPGLSNTPVVCTERTLGPAAPLRILIDWVGFTFNPDEARLFEVLNWFKTYLGIDRDCFKPGRRNYEGYASSLFYENINIYYEGASNQGIHVDFTGQGCRFLDFHYQKLRVQDSVPTESPAYRVHNWLDLLAIIHEDPRIKWTRLDIACDDLHGYLDIQHMFHKCLAGELTMKFRSWTPYGKFDSDGESHGLTLYFGSDSSDIQCVMYEKNKQLNLDYHWTRIELRFSHERAFGVVSSILQNGHDIGITFAGVLRNYLTFRVKNENDSNKRRWPVAYWWENFLAGIPPLKIAAQLPDRSIIRSKKWLNEQVARTIARLYFAYQDIDDNWMSKVLQEGMMKLDEEDLNMIEEFRRIYGKNAQKQLNKDNPFTQENKKEAADHSTTPQD